MSTGADGRSGAPDPEPTGPAVPAVLPPVGMDGPPVEAEVLSRRTAGNAAAAILADVSGKVATLAFTVAAARTLSTSDFGAFSYAIAFGVLVATVPGWGVDPLLVQRGSREPGRLRSLLSETLALETALAAPVLVVAGAIGAALRPSSRSAIALLLVLAASLMDLYSGNARAAAQALQRQRGVSVALVIQRLGTAALGIGALVAGFGLVGLSAAYLAGTMLGVAGSFWTLRRIGVGVDLRSVRLAGMGETLRLSTVIGLDAIVAMALSRVDQIILSTLKGDAAVGPYAAIYRLLETVLFVTWGLARAFLPVMSTSKEPEPVRRALVQGVGILAILYVPFAVGLWAEAGPVIRLLFGERYVAPGVPVARWLAAMPLLFGIGFLGSYALLARGLGWRMFVGTAIAVLFNLALNLALIPSLSATGAAISTTAAYGLEAVVIVLMLAPSVGVPAFHRVLGVPAAAGVAMAALILWLDRGMVVEVPLAVVVYGALWAALARWWTPGQFRAYVSLLPLRAGRRPSTVD